MTEQYQITINTLRKRCEYINDLQALINPYVLTLTGDSSLSEANKRYFEAVFYVATVKLEILLFFEAIVKLGYVYTNLDKYLLGLMHEAYTTLPKVLGKLLTSEYFNDVDQPRLREAQKKFKKELSGLSEQIRQGDTDFKLREDFGLTRNTMSFHHLSKESWLDNYSGWYARSSMSFSLGHFYEDSVILACAVQTDGYLNELLSEILGVDKKGRVDYLQRFMDYAKLDYKISEPGEFEPLPRGE